MVCPIPQGDHNKNETKDVERSQLDVQRVVELQLHFAAVLKCMFCLRQYSAHGVSLLVQKHDY